MSDLTLSSLGHEFALILTSLFAFGAIVNLAAPGFVRRFYRDWDYPRGFHYVVGLIQSLTAVFLAVPETRIWGVISGGFFIFFSVVALLNRRRYFWSLPVILLLAALVPVSFAHG
jgi:hypothetical protein